MATLDELIDQLMRSGLSRAEAERDAQVLFGVTNPAEISPTPTATSPPPATSSPSPVSSAVSFFDQARVLFPWLPDQLVQVYADAWAETDSRDVAYATVVADPQFDAFFPGLKRADGTLRMAPAEYVSTFEGYNRALLEAGVNPQFFEQQFVGLLEGDVSVAEFQQRISTVRTQVLDNVDGVRNFYAQEFGLSDLTDAALVAAAIDPALGDDIFNRRVDISQVGGEAAQSGFTIGRDFATRLVSAGVNQQAARGLFGAAANQLPSLQRSAARFGVDRTLDLHEFTDAAVFQDPLQSQRISRFIRQEQSQFTRSGVRRNRDRLTGLQER